MQMKKLLPESYSDPYVFKVSDALRDVEAKIASQKQRKADIINLAKELKKAIKFAEKVSWMSEKKLKNPKLSAALSAHDKICQNLENKAKELGVSYSNLCWDLMKIV